MPLTNNAEASVNILSQILPIYLEPYKKTSINPKLCTGPSQ